MKTNKLPLLFLATTLCLCGCAPIGFLLNSFTADSAIKAKYKLPKKAIVLVMVDDPHNYLNSLHISKLAESEANYLLKQNEAASSIVPGYKLTALAGKLGEKYSKTAVTTIGKSIGADIVIHAKIIYANLHYTASIYHPTAQVRVKVIDVTHNNRLFPNPGPLDNSQNGYPLNIEMDHSSASQNRNETKKIATRKLAKRIGANLAKLFYDHGERRITDKH